MFLLFVDISESREQKLTIHCTLLRSNNLQWVIVSQQSLFSTIFMYSCNISSYKQQMTLYFFPLNIEIIMGKDTDIHLSVGNNLFPSYSDTTLWVKYIGISTLHADWSTHCIQFKAIKCLSADFQSLTRLQTLNGCEPANQWCIALVPQQEVSLNTMRCGEIIHRHW